MSARQSFGRLDPWPMRWDKQCNRHREVVSHPCDGIISGLIAAVSRPFGATILVILCRQAIGPPGCGIWREAGLGALRLRPGILSRCLAHSFRERRCAVLMGCDIIRVASRALFICLTGGGEEEPSVSRSDGRDCAKIWQRARKSRGSASGVQYRQRLAHSPLFQVA
jgi:hypothetical protein